MYQVTYYERTGDGHVSGSGPTLRDALQGALQGALLEERADMDEIHTLLLGADHASRDEGFFRVSQEPPVPVFRVRAELTEPRTFRRTYETARWFTDVRCQPQSVVSDAFVGTDHKGRQQITFTGRVVDQDLTSLFGGVPVGEVECPDLGKEFSHTFSLVDAKLMRLFTGGGQHEPQPFDHPDKEGLRLHYLPLTWALKAEGDVWAAVRCIGDHEETFGIVQRAGGGFQAVIDAQGWAGPVRGTRFRALRDIIKRTK